MEKMDKVEVLKRSDLFRDLDNDQLGVVAKMCEARVFEPGVIICKQGRTEGKVYVVEDGLVGIILEVGPLAQRQVQSACRFETFGWSGLVEPYTYTATVKAIQKTRALEFKGQELNELCKTIPEIGCKISRATARIVAERLRQAYVQLLGVAYQD